MKSTHFRSWSLLAQRGLSLLVFVLVLVMVLAMLPQLPPPPAAAQGTPLEVEFVGSIGGQVSAVAVDGNYAYIGEVGALTILNISTPALPVRVGRLPLPDVVQDVQVVGSTAYVADWESGLQIIDVSNPAAPTLLGTYDTPGGALGVQVGGLNDYKDSHEYQKPDFAFLLRCLPLPFNHWGIH